jgi:hypothetical protein
MDNRSSSQYERQASNENDQNGLNEFEEVEIPNDVEITSNHATVVAVTNYLNQPENEEFARCYEYTVDHQKLEGTTNFIAKFRLKRQFRESAPSAS